MLANHYIGRNPSHFRFNPFVRAFIISESLLWSAHNFIIPIIAIFVVRNITGGTVEIAGIAFSFHLISRVLIEISTSKILLGSSEKLKLKFTITGILVIAASHASFAFASTLPMLFIGYILMGIGMGIAAPAKLTNFSTHLDKGKEPIEWSAYDALVFIGMALAAALGGLVATQYGFKILFIASSIITAISILPYLLFFKK